MKTMSLFVMIMSPFVVFSSTASAEERPSKSECIDAHERALTLLASSKLRAARAELVTCGAATCPTVLKEECGRAIVEIDASMPTVVVSARDAAGREIVDGRVRDASAPSSDAPLDGVAGAADPGVHRFELVRNGMVVATETALVRQGEKNRSVVITVARPSMDFSAGPSRSAPPGRSPLPFVFAGVGIVGLGTAGILALHMDARTSELASTCAPACGQAERDALSTELVVTNVALGTGIVALAAAAATFIFSPRASEASR